MAYRDPSVGRTRDRERIARRTAERRAAGLCPRCGKRPPALERTVAEQVSVNGEAVPSGGAPAQGDDLGANEIPF